ncbi:MAG: hypothetical protein GHCLOJNM_04362 [bacterium]|nr:hypothetical protein [bacterium]
MIRAAQALIRGETIGADLCPNRIGQHFVFLYRREGLGAARIASGSGEGLLGALEQAARPFRADGPPPVGSTETVKVEVSVEIGTLEGPETLGVRGLDPGVEGLWFPDPSLALSADELLSQGLLDDNGRPRPKEVSDYLASGRRLDLPNRVPALAGESFQRLKFESFASIQGATPVSLYRGNPLPERVTPESLLAASRRGGDYLIRHQEAGGDFGYRYLPQLDSYGKGYNLLRHAGTCYSLLLLYQVTEDVRYLLGAKRGIESLLARAKGPREDEEAKDFLCVATSEGREGNLGGSALAALAVNEYVLATGDQTWLPKARALGRFLLHQQEESGHFLSKYFYTDPPGVQSDSIYYPGEAVLALVRLHQTDGDKRWLQAAEEGARWLIETRDAGKADSDLPHDHWLLMALNELYALTRTELYLRHGGRIADEIVKAMRRDPEPPDWMGSFYVPPRCTPTSTRGEGLVAAYYLTHVAGAVENDYLESLKSMSQYVLRCQINELNGMCLPDPGRALGGFRASLTNWEVRIDYVQHAISMLLGLREILMEPENAVTAP